MYLKKIIGLILLLSSLFTNCYPIFAIDDLESTTDEIESSVSTFSDKEKEKENSVSKKEEFSIDIDLPAKAYILTNYKTGQVLCENNADDRLHIASITKIMTMLLVIEGIEPFEGDPKIKLTDIVTVTEAAKPSNNESSMWAEVGEKISVSDLLKAVAVNSANDAARMLAIHVAGSEKDFVDMMNKRAKELGMKNTNFTNASGMDDENNYSSARDVSIMARELLKHSWITNYTTLKGKKGGLRNGKLDLANTNKLLWTYKGCNGLKTGTEEKAGRCLCATAIRNEIPLCAVNLGSEKDADRWKNCTCLLDYGFNNFQKIKIDKEMVKDKKIPVKKGKEDYVGCKCKDNMDNDYLIKKSQNKQIEQKIEFKECLDAPVKEGDEVGEMSCFYKDKNGKEVVIYKQSIYASEDVDRLNFWDVKKRIWSNFFTGSKFYN